MKKIAIFGGLGFISRNVVQHLKDKYEFILYDLVVDNNLFGHHKNIKCIKCNILDDNIEKILQKENPDFIINTVSIVNAARDFSLMSSMIDVNLNILLKLYEASKKVKSLSAFIHLGSGEEYGSISTPFKESQREEPMSPYALCKQITTNTAVSLYRNYKFPIMVIRPSNLFGDGQPADKFIPYIIGQLKANKSLELSPCIQKRDFISTEQFSEAIDALLDSHQNAIGEIINIGSGISIRLKDVVEFAKKELNSTSELQFDALPMRENEMMDFNLDVTKFNKITGENYTFDFWQAFKVYIRRCNT